MLGGRTCIGPLYQIRNASTTQKRNSLNTITAPQRQIADHADRQTDIIREEIADIAMPLSQFLPRLDVRTWPALIACNQLEIPKKHEIRDYTTVAIVILMRTLSFGQSSWCSATPLCWYEMAFRVRIHLYRGTCDILLCIAEYGANDISWRAAAGKSVVSLPLNRQRLPTVLCRIPS